MFPSFIAENQNGELTIGSQPDLLADLSGRSQNWDRVSLTEFLVSGKVSFPYTYYQGIRSLDFGSVYTIDLNASKATVVGQLKYFHFDFSIDHRLTEWDLAEQLSAAFTRAVRRRTLPIFGKSGVSLSGGLDSRALLSSISDFNNVVAFCFFDEENLEFRIAQAVANKLGVELLPLKRQFDHYGANAEMGVRISGGMGDFGSNHYLGFRNHLAQAGITNILSGFYCDYLFKALALNKRFNRLLRTENFTKFEYANYMPFFWFSGGYFKAVKERIDATFTEEMRKDRSAYGLLKIEAKRLFPLSYEPDNQETVVPQRTMGWYLPIVDNDIIDVYLKIPPKAKLNTSMYSKMVALHCGDKIAAIQNVNTGVRVNASRLGLMWGAYNRAFKKRFIVRRNALATDESWPNWRHYLRTSKHVESLWNRNMAPSREFLIALTGMDPYEKTISEHVASQIKLFLRLLTVKLWFEQRNDLSRPEA
jgi:asparagine synthetase B (glutamine-hydrolysing)